MSEITTLLSGVEIEAWRDLVEAAPAPLRADLGLAAHLHGGALALRARGIDSVLFNRVMGLGVAEDASPQQIDALLAHLGDAAAFVHVDEGARPAELPGWLADRGMSRYHRNWVKMVRGRGPAPEITTALRIRRASLRHGPLLGRLVAMGFDLPEAAAPIFEAIIDRPRWHPFVALDGDRPVAAAGLFVHSGIGYLAFAATHPDHRRRGAQSALMARRLQAADALGCDVVVTETGESVPGDPQHSYRNMLRAGFTLHSLRHNYAPPDLQLTLAGSPGTELESSSAA